MARQPKVELLQAEVDEDDRSFFRLLADGHAVKYITIDPGIYRTDDIGMMPWVMKDADNRPSFGSVKQTQFPAVLNTWHDTYVDYLDLSVGRKLRTGVYEVKCSALFDRSVVAKFARFPWEIEYLQNETTAYQ
ncbi:hypothetical protein BO71DRAFT_489189 [Aspergillus ellipticus CBS 707.79]|uniref:Uncharacterized protein n=1 Tax=Aspergillus ellipticus CBS 707.79 TaxID=1448320 RepID=A0A319DA24_9EURO|nr:hypothetical protein BO71DRAFT_489189 [Aspergillus ellipticus CBS 707.79]